MVPEKLLPYPPGHKDAEAYVEALLAFITSSHTLQTLCGGIHILDFMTKEPDLYAAVLPNDWRKWLEDVETMEFLDLLMRDDLTCLYDSPSQSKATSPSQESESKSWRGRPLPPRSLLDYISSIRSLSLDRTFRGPNETTSRSSVGLSRRIAVGMKPKKAHEVENFATFVDALANSLTDESNQRISHFLDFGSGQNYLGRVLASPLYSRQVIAVERKHLNVDGAKRMDVGAKMVEREVIWRNKKQWKATGFDDAENERQAYLANLVIDNPTSDGRPNMSDAGNRGKILYVEHDIQDGNLDPVILKLSKKAVDGEAVALNNDWRETFMPAHVQEDSKRILCISLHSCGNLSHHGIRSLVVNPFVKGVALVGCCYNLVTERLGPPTYKLPMLRTANKRLDETSSARDSQGFPMSEKLASYEHQRGKGIRLNITARMMAVQAPQNWSESECQSFFTRHFYRALLQRLFLDRGFIKPLGQARSEDAIGGVSPAGFGGGGEPVIIGSLRKSCYVSFTAYVRGAIEKLKNDPTRSALLRQCMEGLTDDQIAGYELRFRNKRHHLSLIWSLMAFSAMVIESVIVTDRWLFLREQKQVRKCWVQTVFDYKQSPRNLVVVGIKK